MEEFFKVLGIISIPVQIFLLIFGMYWLFISFFGFGKPKPKQSYPPIKKFLVLIPAHNEEKVIDRIVDNFNQMAYPKELFDVYVIADNCTDKTAEISRDGGAKVIEHTSRPDEPKGKPHAIRYAFDVLENRLNDYDAFCIFDADNLISVNYFEEMNKSLMSGDQLIQCYLDSKNPVDNWITMSYATSYYFMNRSWQLAKSKLGLGNAIGGTGFCVSMDVLKEVGWSARSLTEDLEFQMQCLLKGIPARWVHEARVYDEKPTGLAVSSVQRLRWARGHWDVFFRYAGPLLKKSIKDVDVLAFDGLMYLLNPGKIVINALVGMFVLVGYFYPEARLFRLVPTWLWFSMLSFQFMYIGYSIIIDAQGRMKKFLGAFVYVIIFNWTYIPLFIWALITKGNKTWIRTAHLRDIDLQDVQLSPSETSTPAFGQEINA